MTRKFWRQVSWPMLLAGLSAPALVNCGSLPKMPGGIPGAPNCPDVADINAVAKFDFAKEFKLDAKAAADIKGGLQAAIALKGLQAKVDADLKMACGGIAKDLGKGEGKDGQETCKLAAQAIGEYKAKLGASATIALDAKPPVCGASIDAMADCAGRCDASLSGGKAEVKCEGGELSGKCSAECKGSCELEAAAACNGTCEGSCEADFSGTCGGTCEGKCDGKAMDAKANGQCHGKCEGKCSAQANGACKGKCGGSCKLAAGAKCEGTCTGSCSVKMEAPKCTGKVEPPQMSADCKAHCDAEVKAKVECSPPHVGVKITGAADAQAAAKLQATLEKNFPVLLKVAVGIGGKVPEIATQMKATIEGAQAGVKAATSGGPVVAGALTACVAEPFTGALSAVANIQASVKVSVDVKASAEAKGSAKAGG